MAAAAIKKIGTHNGVFHCDEILACFMLRLLPQFKNAEIVRSRDPKVLETCDVVVDVGAEFDHGRLRYDHHQKSFTDSMSSLVQGAKWTTKLSSAGLVYAHYGKNIIQEILGSTEPPAMISKIYDKVYEKFIEEIDAVDNGIPTHDGPPRYHVTTTLSRRVSTFRPAWNDPVQDFDAGFWKAMELVGAEFVDRVKFYGNVWWPARSLVLEALEKRFEVDPEGGRIIHFASGGCPYQEHLFDLEKELGIEGRILYAVFQDVNGSFRVAAVPVQEGSFESRLKLHPDWRGLRDDQLSQASAIEGGIFVHATGFIGGNQTKEGAIQMALKTISLAAADRP